MIPGSANPLLLADAGYQIQRSLRFRSSASAYLARTPAVAGNQRTFTISTWVKRGSLSSQQKIFTSGTDISGLNQFSVEFSGADNLTVFSSTTATDISLITTQVFRDPSSWYHLVVLFDTTNATASNRVKLYVNGSQVTSLSTATYPAQNNQPLWGSAIASAIGRYMGTSGQAFTDGYLSEINFIDGQALTPASFGEFSPVTGQWQAKKYSGTYGTNGFYLPFTDNSAATAAAIGADRSGNGNNWTPNNISLTSGVTYDSMLDVPLGTGGLERGNYCVMNPLQSRFLSSDSMAAYTNGNLQTYSATSGTANILGSVGAASGSYFYECRCEGAAAGTNTVLVGFGIQSGTYNNNNGLRNNGAINGLTITSGAAFSFSATDTLGIAVNFSTGTCTYYKNSAQQFTATFSTSSGEWTPWAQISNTVDNLIWNFGQRPFSMTPPTGFKSLHTGNLPDPVIKQPSEYFAATTYLGTGANQNIVNSAAMAPDLVWIKGRSAAWSHALFDTTRGVGKYLRSSDINAEATYLDTLSTFNTDGFGLGTNVSGTAVNTSSDSFVAWQWKKGAAQGFDIVTYAGDGTNGRLVPHSLGVVPAFIITKKINASGTDYGWSTYHKSLGSANIFLHSTAAKNPGNWVTPPTSTDFTPATLDYNNVSGSSYINYLWSEVAGFSKFGSYVGNGSADGAFVYCGFRPRYVMVKRTDVAGNWQMLDSARLGYNALNYSLFSNLSNAESYNVVTDILSSGVKLRDTASDINASGGTYIFMAFAETPFKNSLAR